MGKTRPCLEVLEDRAVPAPLARAAFVREDATTHGDWPGRYGSQGYAIPALTQQPPAYAPDGLDMSRGQYRPNENGNSADPADTRWLKDPRDPSGNSRWRGSWWESRYQYEIYVGVLFNDTQVHRVSLYFVDHDATRPVQTVEVQDYATLAPLATATVSNFTEGKYLTFDVTGSVWFEIGPEVRASAHVLNGVFYDPPGGGPPQSPPPAPHPGDWLGAVGHDGYVLAGAGSHTPSYVLPGSLAVLGGAAAPLVWSLTTTSGRALQTPDGTGRVAAAFTTAGIGNTLLAPLYFSDAASHRVSAYVADWDQRGRAERLDILDRFGNVVSSTTLGVFGGGRMLSWDLSGFHYLRVTALAGPGAVLSGLFFG
jgi:hypothetical protein